jgi:predicted ATPase
MKKRKFVGREHELDELSRTYQQVQSGRGNIRFIAGQAGSGKTALVSHFIQQTLNSDPQAVFAVGTCNAQAGIGDPYLPFRETITMLTGDSRARQTAEKIAPESDSRLRTIMVRSTQILVEIAPDLIGIFVPGGSLVASLGTAVAGKAGWMDKLDQLAKQREAPTIEQAHIFEQYTAFIQRLSTKAPLILFIDDLQWADKASLSLLFHLGRHLKGSRILVLGAYRPEEVALGRAGERHPLEPVVHEITRYYGDVTLDLDRVEVSINKKFVDALIDLEPNDLGEAFRQALFHQTDGHALFTVELLRTMQQRGDLLLNDQGRWMAAPSLDWGTLPARVEGVIHERLGRLPEQLHEMLRIASVEGEVFTAEVIARIQGMDQGSTIRSLSEHLDKQHQLVTGLGRQSLGSNRISRYRFQHILFQRDLYFHLDSIEREYLHEQVGDQLEQLYGEQTNEIAVVLAWHFERAGLIAKAVQYLQQAGERAVSLSAHEEAVTHFSRGLELLEGLPDNLERDRHELALQIALFAPLAAIKGYGAPEVGQAYTRARQLCEKVDDPDQLFQVLYGLWGHNLVRSQLLTSRQLAQECLALAQRVDKTAFLMEAHRMMDETAFYLGEFSQARQHFEQSLALYDPLEHRAHAEVYGQDPGVALLSHGCCILWHLGYQDQALKRSQEAIALAEAQEHPFSLAFALCYSAMMHQYRREPQIVLALAERAIQLSSEQGFVFWLAQARFLRGWALVEGAQVSEGLAAMHQALADWRATGTEFLVAYTNALLAEAYLGTGQAQQASDLLSEAFTMVREKDQGLYEAELYRLKGELLLQLGSPAAEVEKHFNQAIAVARQRAARAQELRATTSLARLLQNTEQAQKELTRLAQCYAWFSEGYDSRDLQQAREVLEG